MQFKKYSSITNSYNEKYLAKIKEYGFDKETYYVTEKVHGANFAIYYDGDKFRIASRTQFLADDCNFYGCQRLLPDLKKKIAIFCKKNSTYGCIKDIVVFGELCGGKYPHKDVKISEHAKKVQGHVWYHPDNIFYAFDIKINDIYIDNLDFQIICMNYEIFNAKQLFQGTLQECLNFNNAYQTTIPDKFWLPKIEDNICEGNVIKPVTPLFFPNGERVILKNKNQRFSEISHKKDKTNEKKELSERANKLLAELLTYVTENRLNNVISKIGEVTIKDFSEVIKQFSADILNEFMNNNDEEMKYLENEEQKILRKTMNSKASTLIRSNLWENMQK
jgi:Rnl2 family RNA ligase